jgi:hypothetical protein
VSDASKKASSETFDINQGARGTLLPGVSDRAGVANMPPQDVEAYAHFFEQQIGSLNSLELAAKSLGVDVPAYDRNASIKAAPPSAFTFGRMSYMPDNAVNGGVIQWPGLAPESLRKVVRENIAPQLIIGMRQDDVLRYSNLSTEIWRPGWRIKERGAAEDASTEAGGAEVLKDIREAQRFLQQSNITTTAAQVRTRDAELLTSFQKWLAATVRDTLTFDAIALWTDMDNGGKVKRFAGLPAGNIRLTTKQGYDGNPNVFAVAVDDGGRVIQAFTRNELTFYTRNPRFDPQVFGYGYSEVEIAMRLIAGFQGAIDLNVDMFMKNSTPNGIVTISGGTVTQRQLDVLTRLFSNMKRGISKAWALPVMGLADKAKLEIHDLSRVKGNEAYYKEWMNMLAGAFCTVYRFPVKRLGYRISGTHRDTEPAPDPAPAKMDETDPGLSPLLGHFETLINEYLIWTRWPHLELQFCGKSPAEDGREYEARSLARTYAEKRKEAGLPPLPKTVAKDLKQVAELMEMCPSDPNLSGAFGTLAGVYLKAKMEPAETAGANGPGKDIAISGNSMTSKIDPARSASHGAAAGVRRDSASEDAGKKVSNGKE